MNKQIGLHAILRHDSQTKHTELPVKNPGHDDIMLLWKNCFQELRSITVCVSGGLDSQFSANLAKKYGNPESTQAIIFEIIWHDNVVNGQDLSSAVRFCERIKLPYIVKQVDITELFDEHNQKEFLDLASQYQTDSPQVLAHLFCLKNSGLENTSILMGGDAPFLGLYKNVCHCPIRWKPGLGKGIRHSTLFHKQYTLPYHFVASSLSQVSMIKDPFLMSSEIYYLAKKKNIQLVKNHKKVLDYGSNMTLRSPFAYKKLYYASFDGFEYIMPLQKKTGFEELKTYFAVKTGIYDYFDQKFREPLTKREQTENWYGKGKLRPTYFVGDYFEIEEQFTSICQQTDYEIVNMYSFDW